MWKSRVFVFGAISKRGGKRGKVRGQLLSAAGRRPDFSTLSTARHFHSGTPTALPSSGRSGEGRARRRTFWLPVRRQAENLFSQGGEVVRDSTDNSGPQSRSLSEAEREALFKRLHLAHMRRIYQQVAVQAEKEGW